MQVPFGGAGQLLLGRACRALGRLDDAKAALTKALRMNPMLWVAFEELCALGKNCLVNYNIQPSPGGPGSACSTADQVEVKRLSLCICPPSHQAL